MKLRSVLYLKVSYKKSQSGMGARVWASTRGFTAGNVRNDHVWTGPALSYQL